MLNLQEYNCKNCGIKSLQDNRLVGLGVYDHLVRDINDPDTGEVYPAISCCNDKTMADRCASPGADKVIWSIKANAQMNSDMAFLLREGFRSGKIRLLVSEFDCDTYLGEIKGYTNMSQEEKIELQLPYINTTLLINELVNLEHDEVGDKVRVHEKSGARKDRYSSLSYSYYVATQLEMKLTRRQTFVSDGTDVFVVRSPGSYSGGANKHKINRR